MALQTSGTISLNDIHVEAGGASGSSATINDADIRALIGKASGAQMAFSEWYGASASQTIATGNSYYQAGTQYVLEQHSLARSDVAFTTGYASAPNFTLNNRTTGFGQLNFSSINSLYSLSLMDIAGGAGVIGQVTHNGHPANSGWSTLVITGNGSSRTFTRTSASYAGTTFSAGAGTYSAAVWTFPSGISNIFPNSNNTTSFTVVIS